MQVCLHRISRVRPMCPQKAEPRPRPIHNKPLKGDLEPNSTQSRRLLSCKLRGWGRRGVLRIQYCESVNGVCWPHKHDGSMMASAVLTCFWASQEARAPPAQAPFSGLLIPQLPFRSGVFPSPLPALCFPRLHASSVNLSFIGC